ncbi:PEP-CTERM sorting domain-containing protein [Pseudodesulfovibrio cashew]|nr:PEP-CTERM sorting domain-containing protein [Pseudodesulfovibrio cashew]
MHKSTILLHICLSALLVMALHSPAFAYIYIEYNEVYTGDTPGGDAPWLKALFEDAGENIFYNGDFNFSSGVLLTLFTDNLVAEEFVSDWYFTFNPDKNVEDLVFTYISGVEPNVKKNVDWTDADGFTTTGAAIPLEINVPFLNGDSDRFDAGLICQIWITGIDDLTSEDFHFLIDAKDEEFISVAHIQGIDISEDGAEANSEGSAWVKGYDPPLPTPEPSTWLLLGVGLALLPLARRRRR